MVRAAAAGAIDFTQADPVDAWWWRKLGWILEEFHRKERREALTIQHNHWITAFSNSTLDEDSFESSLGNAKTLLDKVLIAYYPWLKEQLTQDTEEHGREAAIKAFRDLWGYPGEERYEKMLQDVQATFDKIRKQTAAKAYKPLA